MLPLITTNPKSLPISQATVTADWAAVRNWLNGAGQFERAKLFCQVMAGFELLALKKVHGIKVGGDQKSGSNCNDCNSISWEEILHRETGMAQRTSYYFMQMAKAAAPRLKKLPILNDFDPGAQPLSQLPAPQKEALETAVKKLTDGQTQKEFGESLGLWKVPQGSGATGRKPGEGGRKKLSLAEQAELLKVQAAQDWEDLAKYLSVYVHKFTVLPDLDVNAQIALLERALTARKTWLNQPLNNRQPKLIAEILNH